MSRQNAELIVMFSLLGTMIVIGTLTYPHLEGWTTVESFYFSVSTITTVGYGDMYPTNDTSRLFTTVYMLIGVSLGLVILSFIGSIFLATAQARINHPDQKSHDASLVKSKGKEGTKYCVVLGKGGVPLNQGSQKKQG